MPYEKLKAPKGIVEASGVTRLDETLLIVSDENPGCYFSVPVADGPDHVIPIPHERAERHELLSCKIDCSNNQTKQEAFSLAVDLESIDILFQRVVVLSERLRSILDGQGLIAQYDDPFSEFAEKGLEGLAIRDLGDGVSRVAVLWEGGYLDESELPTQLQRDLAGHVLKPVVLVHDLTDEDRMIKVRVEDAVAVVTLATPAPPDDQDSRDIPPFRFRAPDLVWHEWTHDSGEREWGFIVLLNSETPPYITSGDPEQKPKKHYGPRWLQRFDMAGKPVGRHMDLDTVVREILKSDDLKNANWEGLAWFEPGKRLVLVHDKSKVTFKEPAAVILSIPPDWQK